jgi:DNA-binding FadR family transcriptional regulator
MRKVSSLLVSRVAQDLRKQAFAATPGTYLGSEAELVEQFNVSRPTFRQAAKLVEQEQLLVIKPGTGGGYFVRQPDTAAVAHVTNVFLQSRHTTVGNVVSIFLDLYVLVARAAASRPREDAELKPLLDFAHREREGLSRPMSWETYVFNQAELVEILAALSGNPLMNLFFTITREILTTFLLEKVDTATIDQLTETRITRLKLIEAIRDGDTAIADVYATRYIDEAKGWMLPYLDTRLA